VTGQVKWTSGATTGHAAAASNHNYYKVKRRGDVIRLQKTSRDAGLEDPHAVCRNARARRHGLCHADASHAERQP
jgi:hypothetical protein